MRYLIIGLLLASLIACNSAPVTQVSEASKTDWYCLKNTTDDLLCVNMAMKFARDRKVFFPHIFTVANSDLRLREGSLILDCKNQTLTGCDNTMSSCLKPSKCKPSSVCSTLVLQECN